jgi:hypothetical protein
MVCGVDDHTVNVLNSERKIIRLFEDGGQRAFRHVAGMIGDGRVAVGGGIYQTP